MDLDVKVAAAAAIILLVVLFITNAMERNIEGCLITFGLVVYVVTKLILTYNHEKK